MERKIKFSVVLPTYNCARYVVQALESVLSQERDDFEVIVINDGSTDDTMDRLAPYEGRVKIISQDNLGPGAARNRGIREARAEWIAFQDCDDRWLPGHLDRLERAIEDHPEADMVYTDAFVMDEEGKRVKPKRSSRKQKDLFLELLMDNTISTPAVAARREVLMKLGLFHTGLRSAQDWDMWLRIAYHCSAVHVPETTIECRRRTTSTMHTRGVSTGMREDNMVVMDRVEQMAPGLPTKTMRKARARCLADSGARMLVALDTEGARSEFLSALRLYPGLPRAWLMLALTLGGPALAGALVRIRRWQEKKVRHE